MYGPGANLASLGGLCPAGGWMQHPTAETLDDGDSVKEKQLQCWQLSGIF